MQQCRSQNFTIQKLPRGIAAVITGGLGLAVAAVLVEDGPGGGDCGGGSIDDLHPLDPVPFLAGNFQKLLELGGLLLQIVLHAAAGIAAATAKNSVVLRGSGAVEDSAEVSGLPVSLHRLLPHVEVRGVSSWSPGVGNRRSQPHAFSVTPRLLAVEEEGVAELWCGEVQ